RESIGAWKVGNFLGGKDRATLVSSSPGNSRLFLTNGQQVDFRSTSLREICNILANCCYIGPFRNAISEGARSYYDLTIGTSFISTWDSWKTGPTRANNEAIQSVTDAIAHIFNFKRLEINASPDKKTLQ